MKVFFSDAVFLRALKAKNYEEVAWGLSCVLWSKQALPLLIWLRQEGPGANSKPGIEKHQTDNNIEWGSNSNYKIYEQLACLRAHRQELEQLEHWLREAKVFQGDILSRSAARVGQFSICPAQCTTIIIWYFDDIYLVKWSLYHSFEVWVNIGNSFALTKQAEIKSTICCYTNITSGGGYC